MLGGEKPRARTALIALAATALFASASFANPAVTTVTVECNWGEAHHGADPGWLLDGRAFIRSLGRWPWRRVGRRAPRGPGQRRRTGQPASDVRIDREPPLIPRPSRTSGARASRRLARFPAERPSRGGSTGIALVAGDASFGHGQDLAVTGEFRRSRPPVQSDFPFEPATEQEPATYLATTRERRDDHVAGSTPAEGTMVMQRGNRFRALPASR